MQFAPDFVQRQLVNHCGPSSASACLAVLGLDVSQRGFAHGAHIAASVWANGASEEALLLGLRNAGASGRPLRAHTEADRGAFLAELRRTLADGQPALLIVDDSNHWVALLGLSSDDRFLVMDPNDGDQVFSRWTDRTLLAQSVERPHVAGELHYAVTLARTDGLPPRWRLTPDLVRLCEEKGAYDTADAMHGDLVEALEATPRGGARVPLAPWLRERAKFVVDTVQQMVGEPHKNITRRDLTEHMEAYAIVAEATSLELSEQTPGEQILAPLTAVLCVLAIRGEL